MDKEKRIKNNHALAISFFLLFLLLKHIRLPIVFGIGMSCYIIKASSFTASPPLHGMTFMSPAWPSCQHHLGSTTADPPNLSSISCLPISNLVAHVYLGSPPFFDKISNKDIDVLIFLNENLKWISYQIKIWSNTLF